MPSTALPRVRPMLAALAALLMVVGLTQPAAAADTTTLSGVVSFGSAGSHPAGVVGRVTADVSLDGWSWNSGAVSTDADANGAYTLAVPTNSWVRLRFGALQTGWQSQYYLDHDMTNLATVIPVGTSAQTGLNQTVPSLGSISGRVYLGSTAQAAASGQVRVSWQVCREDGCISGPPTTTLTDSSGNYSFSSLYNGTYTLTFALVSGSTFQPPTPLSVVVNNAQTVHTGRDVTMAPTSGISGRVYLGSTSTPAGAGVTVFYSSTPTATPLGSTTTDSTGAYAITGLADGYYYLRFDFNGDGYADEWWNDAYGDLLARNVRVTSSTSPTADAVLAPGATLTGHVSDSQGTALVGTSVTVRAYYGWNNGDTYGVSYTATTNSSGDYRLAGLPVGTYSVRFWEPSGQYADRTITVAVPAGGSKTADMQFFRGTTVDGFVTCSGCVDGIPGPRASMSVSLETRASAADPWVSAEGAYGSVRDDGYYYLYGVLPAEYRAVVTYQDGPYYTGRATYALSTTSAPFTVLEGQSRRLDAITVPTSPNQVTALYAYLGGASGALGAPVSAVVSFPDAGGGILQHYENGSIYSSYAGGTHVLWADAFRAAYWAANSIFGAYGWPASNLSCDLAGNCSLTFTKGTISLAPLAVTQAPVISGSAIVGGAVTVSTGTYSPAATSYTYAWFRDGARIAGATSSKYAPVAADAGKPLTAQVTAARPGSDWAATMTSPTAPVGPSAAMQITALYGSTGGPSGPLGAATSAIVNFPDNGGGWLQHYANGSIYSSNNGGTHILYPGPIREVYWGANSVFSSWGWPAGERDCTSGTCTQAFTGGTIAPAPLAVTQAPTITGTPMVGGMLSAAAGAYTPAATSYTFSWLRDGARITGAVAATYIPTSADLGHTLQVEVTAVRSTRVPVTTTSAATAAVGPGAPSLAPNPTIAGSAKVGSPLVASVGTWAGGTTWTYQWLAGGTAVSGAVDPSFTPGPAEFGKPISVRVVGSNPAYASTTRTSGATAALAAAAFAAVGVPTIDGAPRVGTTLTAMPGTWAPAPAFSYQWYANGVAITTARSSTFTPGGAQLGATITVTVTGTSTGYSTTSRTSAATGVVAAGTYSATPEPSVTGTPAIGSTLAASTAGWDAGTTFAYRWFSDNVPISGATGSTFAPTAAQLGESITVRVTTTTVGYPVVARESSAGTGPVVRGTFATSPTPTIGGPAKKGATLTAAPGTWAPAAVLVYQWYADGSPIPGAESATFVPTAAQVGATITVRVVGTKAGWTSTTRMSAPTVPVAP